MLFFSWAQRASRAICKSCLVHLPLERVLRVVLNLESKMNELISSLSSTSKLQEFDGGVASTVNTRGAEALAEAIIARLGPLLAATAAGTCESTGSRPSYNHPGAALMKKSVDPILGVSDPAPSKASGPASTWNPKVAITMAAALASAGTGGKPIVDTRLRATPRRLEEGNSARKPLGGSLNENRESGGRDARGTLPMTPQLEAASRRAEFEVLPFAQEWVLRACRIAAGPSHQATNAQTSSTTPPAVPCSPPMLASPTGAGVGVGGGAAGPGGLFLGYGYLFGGDGSARMTEVQEQQQPPLCCRLEPTRIEPDLALPAPPIAATSTGTVTPAVRLIESPGGHRPAPKENLIAEMGLRQCETPAVDAAAQWPALYFPFLNNQQNPQQ